MYMEIFDMNKIVNKDLCIAPLYQVNEAIQ